MTLLFDYRGARRVSMAFATEVAYVRDLAGLSDEDIARATGVGISTVGTWIRRTRSPTGTRAERVAELSTVVERLAQVMEPAYIPVWLHKPLAVLDDDKPLDVLARGDYRRVVRAIAAFESPVAS